MSEEDKQLVLVSIRGLESNFDPRNESEETLIPIESERNDDEENLIKNTQTNSSDQKKKRINKLIRKTNMSKK